MRRDYCPDCGRIINRKKQDEILEQMTKEDKLERELKKRQETRDRASRSKHLRSVINKHSIFHDGENFICAMSARYSHELDGEMVFDDKSFCIATLDGDRLVTQEYHVQFGAPYENDAENEYLKKLAQLRADKYFEEEYEYGFEFSDKAFKYRAPYQDEYFGIEPPNIHETLKRFKRASKYETGQD